MALSKQIQTETGVTANYHKIDAVHSIQTNGAMEAYVGEYVDEATRRDGKAPVKRHRHNIQLSQSTVDKILELIYSDPAMKSGPYAKATDVLDEEAR